jgi:hypothetical protein
MSSGVGTITKNLWFNGTGNPSVDTAPVIADPLFVTPGADFHLQANSPAIGAGSANTVVTSLVTTDFNTDARSATSMDIGALKH